MSITLWTSSPNSGPILPVTATASQAYTSNKLLVRSNGEAVDGASPTTINLLGVTQDTQTTGSTSPTIRALLLTGDSSQLFVVDCTNNTAANQLNKTQAMTDSGTVNNTSTENTTTAGVFMALAIVGVASDKKLLGYFVKLGQVTA